MTQDWFGVRPVSQQEKDLRADLKAVAVAAQEHLKWEPGDWFTAEAKLARRKLQEALARPGVKALLEAHNQATSHTKEN